MKLGQLFFIFYCIYRCLYLHSLSHSVLSAVNVFKKPGFGTDSLLFLDFFFHKFLFLALLFLLLLETGWIFPNFILFLIYTFEAEHIPARA